MGFGIFQPTHSGHVPGTVTLYEDGSGAAVVPAGTNTPQLKRDAGKDSTLVLVPQPSDSPNDPLNWPLWKRDLTLIIMCLASSLAGTCGPVLATVNGVLVKEFHTTFTETALWSGHQFWAAAVAGLLGSVVGRVWGKRPVYLVSILLMLIGNAWNACVHTSAGFTGARIIAGFGLGAFETVVGSSLGDLYFVHERGKRIAFYHFAFIGTAYFMPVIGGHISRVLGWRWQFIIISLFLGPTLILAFLFLPEHAYNRPLKFETDLTSMTSSETLPQGESVVTTAGAKEGEGTQAANGDEQGAASGSAEAVVNQEKKKTFVQELKVYNGRFSDESAWKLLLTPFVLMIYPATIWAFILQGTFVTWGIGIAIVMVEFLSGPPTYFTPEQIGYVYTAPFIGALVSYAMGGFLSDRIATFMAKRNKNIYEPEFRVLLIIPVMLTALPGLFAYGWVAEQNLPWTLLSFCYGLVTYAVVMTCTVNYAYILDAHRDISVEMLVSILILKNFFAFGSTYYMNHWLEKVGPKEMFWTLGGIQTVICLISMSMYFFGKLQRDLIHRYNILKKLDLYPKRAAETSHS